MLLALLCVGPVARELSLAGYPITPLAYIDTFAVGVVAAIVVVRVGSLRRWTLVVAGLAFAAGLSITGVIGIEWGTATALVGPLFAIALAIAALASNSVPRSLVWLGTVSYGIYLWHWPVLKFTTAHGLYRLPDSVEIVVVAVLSITLGWLSWKMVEMPALRLRPQLVRLLRTDKPDGGLPGTRRVAADHDESRGTWI